MVKIAVIGWYGTETIGDRAIFSGLLNLLSEVYKDIEIKLGALYPTLTHRTVLEDYDFYCLSAQKTNLPISIFDSTNVAELKSAIKWADLLVMGGGPLMDIREMNMVDFAFKYAKKQNTKSAVLGCGVGPLTQSKYIKAMLSIVAHSDLTIFRDDKSLNLYHQFRDVETSNCLASIDSALFTAELFKSLHKNDEKEEKVVVVNLREIDVHYSSHNATQNLFEVLKNLLQSVANQHNVLLVPMHTFGIGGDDRYILNRLAKEINSENLQVQNIPLSLEDTMNVFFNAEFCIGMRFHSVLLQMILNGKNYILDYTDPQKGKIINLLEQLKAVDFYKPRYYSLANFTKSELFSIENDIPSFVIDKTDIYKFRNIYVAHLTQLKI